MFSTLSTVRLLILRGACSGCDLRKSIIMSSVLSALSTRLFSVHQHSRYLISSLYIGFTISVNASHYCGVIANLMIWFPLCLDAQSCVSGVNNNGLITQPHRDGVGSVISDTDKPRSLRQKVLDPETWGGFQSKQEEFLH